MRLRRLDLHGISAFGRYLGSYGDMSYEQRSPRFMDYILYGYDNNPFCGTMRHGESGTRNVGDSGRNRHIGI